VRRRGNRRAGLAEVLAPDAVVADIDDAVAVEVGNVAAVGGAELLAPDAVVANVDDAVVVDVPEQPGTQARAPGAPLDGRRGWRRGLGRLTRPPGGIARGEYHGEQNQQRGETRPPRSASRH